MDKIINIPKASSIADLLKKNKESIVLVGGCFDIIHIGHIKFLKEAKKMGDRLFILLESDQKVRKLKGENRPIIKQKERAIMLSSISYTDYIVILPFINSDIGYDRLALAIKPDIIAATENDPCLLRKRKQAELVGGKIKIVPLVKTFSSSKLVKLLGLE